MSSRSSETISAAVCPDKGPFMVNLRHIDNERVLVFLYEVPGIRAQLCFDLFDKARRSEQMDLLVSPEKEAKELIESDEMIHVHVGDEDMADL